MKVRLSKIPHWVQKMYRIGATVMAETDSSVPGGYFTFENNEGQPVGVDAVELFGSGILIEELT